MKKDYNRLTTSDMPLDSSFTPQVEVVKEKKITSKPKINAVGKSTTSKAKTGGSKTSGIKSGKSATTKSSSSSNSKLRTKLVQSDVEISDLEKLNEENIKSYRFKSKRNKVVIVVLSILLAITIATIAIYASITNLETNCKMIVHDVDATFFVNDEEMTEFRAPANLQGDCILNINIKIKINESGLFKIRFEPVCYQKGVLMENTLIHDHNVVLFDKSEDETYCYSTEIIEGNQIIFLCNGIIIDDAYEKTLNVDNFQFEFHVYVERVTD